MAEFEIVDLSVLSEASSASSGLQSTVAGQSASGGLVGHVDTATVASELEALRKDLTDHVKAENNGLALSQLVIKLTVSASGKVAFVASGSAEASIEATFTRDASK